MGIHVDSVSAMAAFVQAAELRSFKLAGQQFGLSSSAIGKTIAKLEDQLGVRLFHRSTRSISLTREGEMFLDRCRHVLCELEAAEAELAQATDFPRGRLRVGLPVTMSELLTPLIADFLDRYPEVELDLDYNDRLVDVVDNGFDAVIRSGEASDSRLMHAKLGEFTSRLVASPDYLERAGEPTTAEDLLGHRLLHHRFYETGKLSSWAPAVPDSLPLPMALAATSIEPLIRLAEAGSGIAHLPCFAVAERLRAGTLKEVLPHADRQPRAVRLLWPRSKAPLPKLSAFVQFMIDGVRRALVERAV